MQQSEMDQVKGYIFDIQRYSIHDGPGIRSTVFFKGCPLHCTWCENPESQKQSPQLLYIKHLCRRCRKCVEVCQNQANRVLPDGSLEVDRKLCQACGRCVEVCPLEARQISGKLTSVEEVLDVVKRDALFYKNSGGGITASGGEPTAQPAFLLSLFKECQRLGFHTALDTCGFVKWEVLEPILGYVNLVLFDIKQTDPEVHRQLTGVNNQLILENAKKIVAAEVPLIVRVPLIPGFNDSEETLRALAQFALELDGQQEVNLLPYHKFGSEKFESLGLQYELDHLTSYTEEEINLCAGLIRSYGLRVEVV